MTLIKSISGIRGTIGGKPLENLTPIDVAQCVSAYAQWIKSKNSTSRKIVVGRDGRISGKIVSDIAISSLVSMGLDVIDLGLSTTPTVEMMVPKFECAGGIIFTASHNPKQWNALKFLNHNGEFISATDGQEILALIDANELEFVDVDSLGTTTSYQNAIEDHIQEVLALNTVDIKAIKAQKFHIVIDCINSTGAISIPPLLDHLGCTYTLINAEITGQFAHDPEPLPKHLIDLSNTVIKEKAHLGISVDPDVDRLAFISEDGSFFGEEYTLVAIADHILSITKGNTVSNLSSTRALADVTKAHGGSYAASAVGEVNVVNQMKATNAVIGGEGNGGIIVPELHYGRDAIAGIALMLSHLANKKQSMSSLRASYPDYEIIKEKIALTPAIDVDDLLVKLEARFKNENINTIDGLKIDFPHGWVHLRKSNTEPIIRLYAEAHSVEKARELAQLIQVEVDKII